MCSRTRLDINQDKRVFVHLKHRKTCEIRKNVVPLHPSKG